MFYNIEKAMRVLNFKYLDAKGKESERELMVVKEPTDKFYGYDSGELSAEEVAEFAFKYDELYHKFQEQVSQLVSDFDLKYRYRCFFENKMTNLVVEEV